MDPEFLPSQTLEANSEPSDKLAAFRERLSLGMFFERMFEILQEWSKIRDPLHIHCKPFATSPVLNTKLFTNAFQWSETENAKNCKFRTADENLTYWFVSPSTRKSPKIKDTDINKFLRKGKTLQ